MKDEVIQELVDQYSIERKNGMDYSIVRKKLQSKKLSTEEIQYILDEIENNVLGINRSSKFFDFRRLLAPFFIIIISLLILFSFYYLRSFSDENSESSTLVNLKVVKIILSLLLVIVTYFALKKRNKKRFFKNRFDNKRRY